MGLTRAAKQFWMLVNVLLLICVSCIASQKDGSLYNHRGRGDTQSKSNALKTQLTTPFNLPPKSQQHFKRPARPSTARKLYDLYQDRTKLAHPTWIKVPMGQAAYIDFQTHPGIESLGFNGCTGMILFNESSAIIAHQVPYERIAVARLESLARLHEMQNCEAIVYVPLDNWGTGLRRGVDAGFIEEVLRRLEVSSVRQVRYRIPGKAARGYIGIDRERRVTIAPREAEVEVPFMGSGRSLKRRDGGD